MKKTAAIFAIAAGLGAAPALAQGWYVGAGIGQGTVDFPNVPPGVAVDDKETTYQLRLGYRFHPSLGVELGYYRMGKYGLSATSSTGARLDVDAEASAVGLSLVGTLPLDRFDLYGRVGYARSEVKTNAVGLGFTQAIGFGFEGRSRENEWFAGVGGRFNLTREVGVFAEWQRHDKLEVDGYFLGVDLRF